MKKITLFFAAVMLTALAASCTSFPVKFLSGNGVSSEQELDVHGFTAIEILGSMDVYYTQGPESVTLTADENLMEYYSVSVVAGNLTVTGKKGYILSPKAKTYLTVSAPDLSKVIILGSGDCELRGDYQTDGDFSFALGGSGDLEAGRVSCKDFSASITGSGDINVASLVATGASFTISGSGDIEVDALTCDSAKLRITGSGNADIVCRDAGDITVNISGSGDVRLSGTARSLDANATGSGRIYRDGLILQ